MLKLIRKAIKKDIEQINNLGENLHQDFARIFHIETEIDSNIAIVLVSETNDKINGYLYALDFKDNIDLLSIFVDEEYRNNHIGTSLIKYLAENFNNKTITLEVSENNIAALTLYYNLGFKIVNVRKKYYGDKDAYIMKWGI